MQPEPKPNNNKPVWELVIEDVRADPITATLEITDRLIYHMQKRDEKGVKEYHTHLQAHNGRDVLTDLLEELLDATAYARQGIEEGRDLKWYYDSVRRMVVLLIRDYNL